jgi:antitoxin component YwqK of YwqJK toxin-antitoxin module
MEINNLDAYKVGDYVRNYHNGILYRIEKFKNGGSTCILKDTLFGIYSEWNPSNNKFFILEGTISIGILLSLSNAC